MPCPTTALIYAAGRGERMRPLTLSTPKPLLPVGGKPLIVWHLQRLAAAGVRNVVINTAHLAEQFPAVLGDGERFGLRIRYSFEGPEPLETGGGLRLALPLLGDDPFIVVNGDIWTDFDFSTLPNAPTGLAHLMLISLPPFRTAGNFERAVSGLLPPSDTANESFFTLAGIAVYRPQLVAHLPQGTYPILPALHAAIERGAVSVERLRGEWHDIGTPERLQELDVQLTQRV